MPILSPYLIYLFMTDHSEMPSDLDEEVLLNKIDAVLLKYRRESSAVIHPKEAISPFPDPVRVEEAHSGNTMASGARVIPVLTERCALLSRDWPEEADISLLLCYAFDAALREARINLSPGDRLALLRALSHRLPKNL